jgi:hypothetical protein
MPDATTKLMIGPLFRCGVFFFSRGVGEDVLKDFLSTEDFIWYRSRLESRKDESRDCNQNQEKGMRRKDYSSLL